jgi:taurine dioxygenase
MTMTMMRVTRRRKAKGTPTALLLGGCLLLALLGLALGGGGGGEETCAGAPPLPLLRVGWDKCEQCGASDRLGALLDLGDLKELDDAKRDILLDAIVQYGTVVVRGQNLTRAEQVALTNRIGEAVVLPGSFEGQDPEPGEPAIQRITNFWANGTWKGPSHSFGAYWHQDGQFWQRSHRYLFSILYSAAAPPPGHGGQTGFVDLRAALATLSEPLKERAQGTSIRASVRDIADFTKNGLEEDLAAFPAVRHPLLDTHPSDGTTPNLYLGSPHMKVDGLESPEAGKALLELLFTHATSPSFSYFHHWQAGDVVFWDNTQTLHKAMPFDNDGTHLRELYRTQSRVAPCDDHLAAYSSIVEEL